MSVSERICAYLQERDLPLEEVAARANIPLAVLEATLSGKRAMYVDELRALCYALGVAPETFIDATNPRGN